MLRLVEPLLDDPERYGAAMDPKTSLQELASRIGRCAARYAVTSTGPDHDRTLHRDRPSSATSRREGTGTSKKQAEMAAALRAWHELSARA